MALRTCTRVNSGPRMHYLVATPTAHMTANKVAWAGPRTAAPPNTGPICTIRRVYASEIWQVQPASIIIALCCRSRREKKTILHACICSCMRRHAAKSPATAAGQRLGAPAGPCRLGICWCIRICRYSHDLLCGFFFCVCAYEGLEVALF